MKYRSVLEFIVVAIALAVIPFFQTRAQETSIADTLPVSGKPYFLNGKELQRRLALAGRQVQLSPSDTIDARDGMTYVTGVADAIQGLFACPSGGERTTALFPTVNKYIAEHPDQLSDSAAIVVKHALRDAFPCPAKASEH